CSPCLRWDATVGAWIWGIHGTVGVGGRRVDVDSDWTDTLDQLDKIEFAFNGRVQASWQRWWAAVQVDASKLGDSVDFKDGNVAVDGSISLVLVQPELGYKLWSERLGCSPCAPTLCAGPYVGARIVSAKLDIDSVAAAAPGPSTHRTKTWVDPLVGLRA